jgi:predicted nucleic acid-binding protein
VPRRGSLVIYWDSSAILSALFKDNHSTMATEWASKKGYHLISSLAHVEIWAVVSRMNTQGFLSSDAIQVARVTLASGLWRSLTLLPDRDVVSLLAMKWPLRGADLWHLSAAKTLQATLPETYLLTFDKSLEEAARGEGLIH